MLSLFRFDDYKVIGINSRLLIPNTRNTVTIGSNTIKEKGDSRNYRTMLTPIPKGCTVSKYEEYKGSVSLDEYYNARKGNISQDSSLYIHPNCTIPRNKVTEKFKKHLTPEKADICVVPDDRTYINCAYVHIFINRELMTAYVIFPEQMYSCIYGVSFSKKYLLPTLLNNTPHVKASDAFDLNKVLNSSTKSVIIWNQFLNSELLYSGWVMMLRSKNTWLADLVTGKLHHIVTEKEIMPELEDESKDLTKEDFEGIKQLLGSNNGDNVKLGLKVLAAADYHKYYNSTVQLLKDCYSNIRYLKHNSGSSVEYMMKYLNAWDGGHSMKFRDTITEDDFELMKSDLDKDIKELINKMFSYFTNTYKFLKFNVDIFPSLEPRLAEDDDNTKQETKENEEDG